ncbi:MAG: hypothetical protein AAB209_05965 [Bacteroidota bacterium]|jgi:TolA-binding protein
METNGDFKKYFDALNKRLDGEFGTIDKRLVALESSVKAQGQLVLAMQQTQTMLSDSMVLLIREVKELKARVGGLEQRVGSLEQRASSLEHSVERLEIGQAELIKMVTRIDTRLSDFESGKKFELKEVRYDEAAQTLTGVIREKKTLYIGKTKKRRN